MANRKCHPTGKLMDGQMVFTQETETIRIEVDGRLLLDEICTTCGASINLCPIEVGKAQMVFTELVPDEMLFQQRF